MGIVPPEARVGDSVYSVWECIVVRNVSEDRWMIVGRAHLPTQTLRDVIDKRYADAPKTRTCRLPGGRRTFRGSSDGKRLRI